MANVITRYEIAYIVSEFLGVWVFKTLVVFDATWQRIVDGAPKGRSLRKRKKWFSEFYARSAEGMGEGPK